MQLQNSTTATMQGGEVILDCAEKQRRSKNWRIWRSYISRIVVRVQGQMCALPWPSPSFPERRIRQAGGAAQPSPATMTSVACLDENETREPENSDSCSAQPSFVMCQPFTQSAVAGLLLSLLGGVMCDSSLELLTLKTLGTAWLPIGLFHISSLMLGGVDMELLQVSQWEL